MIGQLIETDADVAKGADWLAARDAKLAAAYAETGSLPLRRTEGGFTALLNAIVGQQISVAAAKGIWARLEAAGATSPEGIRMLDEAELRGCGLSRPKVRYAMGLADCDLDFDSLKDLPDKEVIARLVEIKGIGVWTAEIYAKFSLGRADVFAAGDLALQESARLIYGHKARPTEAELRKMAEDWSPWRAVAARLLWAYYRVAKDREGIQ